MYSYNALFCVIYMYCCVVQQVRHVECTVTSSSPVLSYRFIWVLFESHIKHDPWSHSKHTAVNINTVNCSYSPESTDIVIFVCWFIESRLYGFLVEVNQLLLSSWKVWILSQANCSVCRDSSARSIVLLKLYFDWERFSSIVL